MYTPNQRLALFPEDGSEGPSLQHTANAAMLALVFSQYHTEYSLTYRCASVLLRLRLPAFVDGLARAAA